MFTLNNEENEIVNDYVYPGPVIKPDGHCSQEIRRNLRLGRAIMKELEMIIKCRYATGDQDQDSSHSCIPDHNVWVSKLDSKEI